MYWDPLVNRIICFSTSSLTINSSNPANKQIVILHDAPATPPASLIKTLAADKIAYIYITDGQEASDPYDVFPTQWTTFVSDVAATN